MEELLVSSLAQTEALAKLLIEKELITREEFMQKISAVVAVMSTGSRTYLIAPGQSIQVNAPNGGQIGFDVLIAA